MLITGYVKSTKKEKGEKSSILLGCGIHPRNAIEGGVSFLPLIVYLMKNKPGQTQPWSYFRTA